MKKTTYILLATLLTLAVLIVLSPCIIRKFADDKIESFIKEISINNKMIKQEYKGITAIKLINKENSGYIINCNTEISPSESDITTISLPDNKYFKSYMIGDTLIVSLKIKNMDNTTIVNNMPATFINIKTSNKLKYIMTDRCFNGGINGMKGDSISVNLNNGGFYLNKSQYRSIDLKGNSSSFTANESTIDSLYIDTDNYNNWKVERCKINTEFITGSSYVDNHYGKDECKRIVWIPKSKDAKFVIDAKAVITPCK